MGGWVLVRAARACVPLRSGGSGLFPGGVSRLATSRELSSVLCGCAPCAAVSPLAGFFPLRFKKKEMCVTRAELALAEASVRSLEGVPATFAALVCAALSVFSWLGVLSVARGWEARGVVGVGCSRCPGLRPESRPISA